MAQRWGVIGQVRGKGLLLGVELVRDNATRQRFGGPVGFGVRVGRRALERGLLCRFDPHWIAFGPPLVVTDEHVDEILALFEASLCDVLAE